jgi:hypothetical protein
MERSRRASLALIGITITLGLVLTACGARPAPGPSARSHTAESYTAASYAAASRGVPPHGSRAAGLALGRRMVRHLRLPPGSRVVRPHPVPPYLRQPADGLGVPLRVDLKRFYWAPRSAHATYSYLRRHVPAGYRLVVTGTYLNGHRTVEWVVGYYRKSLPPGISNANLIVGVVAGRHGRSVLRADGEVGWFPPRSAAEYLRPAAYRAVVITRTNVSSGRRTTRTVRSRAALARLARLLNSRQATNSGPVSCPYVGPLYRLVFRPRAGHPRFVVTAFGCMSGQVTVAGRAQPELWDPGNRVDAAAQRLLHARAG